MDSVRGVFACLIFAASFAGAVWPLFHEQEVGWRYDMDIRGGVQVAYRADFSSLPDDQQTPERRRALMDLSHARLDARLAQFQGADVRVQRIGDDRLMVEVPGVDNIAAVKLQLGKPRVVRFARVDQISFVRTSTNAHEWRVGSRTMWIRTDPPINFGGDIDYSALVVVPQTSGRERTAILPLRLSRVGAQKMSLLTTNAYERPPAVFTSTGAAGVAEKAPPMIALFLDDDLKDAMVVRSPAIGEGSISTPSVRDAEVLRRLLSSGPMPVNFRVDSERRVSAVVGEALLDNGLLALAVSLLGLMSLILVCYLERPGFVFVYITTLMFWLFGCIALANLGAFRISLMQLAGFVLLLGMNTDSLVLVFEDLREAFKRERSYGLVLPLWETFKREFWVIFWGMATTAVVIVPLWLQGGVFKDYVLLMVFGMVLNVLGYIFGGLLLGLPFVEQMSRRPIPIRDASSLLSKIDFGRLNYRRVAPVLVFIAAAATFIYPRVELGPVFGGGTAIELVFPEGLSQAAVQSKLGEELGRSAEVLISQNADGSLWALAKIPKEQEIDATALVARLEGSLGGGVRLLGVESLSRTLVAATRLRVGAELFIGFVFLIAICIYVYDFSVTWRLMFSLFHDVLFCLAAMAIFGIHLNLTTITALATMAGYSMNDSIVILHKLRGVEMERRNKSAEEAAKFDPRVEVLRRLPGRILITATTTAAPMVLLALLAGGVFRDYAIIVGVGVAFGTLSSLYFVARADPSSWADWKI